ncbi:MAG: glycosyl hydrolase family 8 [Candidatus Goldbacteria bacterium]|nr:glycosyl hydrolase family 8 [Candidatus Goldiibacteriota bacterium]
MKKSNIKIIIIEVFIIIFLLYSITFASSANFPFPIDCDYPNGIRITSYSASDLLNKYNQWKSKYVVNASPGQRVISPEPINGINNRTLSEGQAYGMLLSVYFNDQTLFNNLWAFKVARSSGKTSQLMPWLIENNGTTIVDQNSASDADFDIAFALLMAHYQWGSGGAYNYQTLAATEIARCRQYDINAGSFSVKPGDAWNDWGYPSYYSPAFFRVFGEVEGGTYQTTWDNVVQRCLNNINTNRNSSSGLVGEICDVSTGARRYDNPCTEGCDGQLYKYNSCRVPWRYAMDWLWYGNVINSSGDEVNLLASFFNSIAPADVKDGYRISDNSVEGTLNKACFVGPAGCALMYSSIYSSSLTNYYTKTISFDINDSYYSSTIQLLTLLLMTGNFHDLRNVSCNPITPIPTNTSTPTLPVSGQLLDCFDDNNGLNDWGGEWYTYADRSTCMLVCNIWPAPGSVVTMSSGGISGSSFYLQVTGVKQSATPALNCYPFLGFGTDLKYRITQTGETVDLRPFKSANGGLRFWARGSGITTYKVMLVPKGVGSTIHLDNALYEYTFTPPSSWTQFWIPFNDFTQPTWSNEIYSLDDVLQVMQKIQWQNGTNDAMTFDFSLDCIELYPYLWTPTPNISPTSTITVIPPTNTITRTVTPTSTPTVTPTISRTMTASLTRTITSTFSFTITGTPPTNTITRTVTPTSTPTVTPTVSRIVTVSATRTVTPTVTRTVTPTITLTMSITIPTPGFTVIIDDIDGGADKGEQIVKLPDGSFLVVGIVWDDNCTCYISVIWKYKIDGTLDTSFGGGDGIMECPVPGTTFVFEDGISIYVDINGYIYVTGYVIGCGGTCKNLVVYRLNANGTIDTTFGSGSGYVIYTSVTVNINVSIKSYITFDSMGRILIVSKTWNGSNYDMIIIRCNPDGSYDLSFCSGVGYCLYDYSGGDDAGYKVYIDDINFNIYIVGYVTVYGAGCTPSCKAIAVWKLLPNGTPDPSFNGGNCYIYYDILKNHLNCEAISIVVTVTGEIYITGYVDDGSGCVITCKKMIVIKLTSSGTIDVTFGINGIFIFETYPGIGVDIGLDFDGKIVVAGTIYNGANTDLILWKLLINGSLDLSYNSVGYGIYDSGRNDWAKGVLIYALCTYLVTGYSDVIGSNYDMLVWFDGCSKYPTPTFTRTLIQTLTPTNTFTPTVTPSMTPTMTQTITLIITMTATPTATATMTNTPSPTQTITISTPVTLTVTHSPVITPTCNGTTTPTYTVHLIYNPEHSDYVIIEIESSVILKTLPVVDIYPHCGCPPTKKVIFSYTAELIPGETKKYRVLYPKQTGFGDIDKVIVKGTDLCNVYGESDGSYTKETISRQDLIVFKNVIKPDNAERSRIVFKIYGGGDHKVNVFNRNGVLIKKLFDENITEQSGEREVIWDGTNSAGKKVVSGIYIVVAKSPYYEAKEKIVVIR